MQATDIPAQISLPFAEGAGTSFVDVIPVTTAVAGRASLTLGFPPLNFTPIASGGIPPFGQDMNGILNMISAWTRWLGAGGPVYWDSAFSTAINGYPLAAIVRKLDDSGCWLCTADNNTTDPETGGANWTFLPFLEPTGVTPGSYTSLIATIDAYGRITAAASGSGTLPPSGVTPGTYTNVTMTVNLQGIVTFAESGLLANAGVAHFIGAMDASGGSASLSYTAPEPVKVTLSCQLGSEAHATLVNGIGVAGSLVNDPYNPFTEVYINLDTGQSISISTSNNVIVSSEGLGFGGSLIQAIDGTSVGQTVHYTATKNVRLEMIIGGGGPGAETLLNGAGVSGVGPVGVFRMAYVNLGPTQSVTIFTTQYVMLSEEQLTA